MLECHYIPSVSFYQPEGNNEGKQPKVNQNPRNERDEIIFSMAPSLLCAMIPMATLG